MPRAPRCIANRSTGVGTERRPHAGVLHLTLQRRGTRTVVRDGYFQVPLQVMRPLYLDDAGIAYVYLLSPCGGVVGGDVYTITVVLEQEAHACLTTPSATKLYAAQAAPARQHLTCTLHDRAILEYVPEQIIPYAQAAFHQDTTIHLGAGACVLWQEILAPGRLARGEAFAYRDYRAALRILDRHGQLLVYERTRLQPLCGSVASLGVFEGYAYLGTCYAVVEGTTLPESLVEHLHGLFTARPRLIGSATHLEHGGIAIRVLGADHTTVAQAMQTVWDVLRWHILGQPAITLRK